MNRYENKIKGHTFVSLEEMVCDIVKDYKQGKYVEIYVPCDEAAKLIISLLSTELFTPLLLDWSIPEMNGYCAEYIIAIHNDGEFFVEPIWDEENERYLYGGADDTDTVYVSENVDISLTDSLIDQGYSGIIFYNVES